MNTLLLDRTVWDLVLDSSGNIALAADPYAQAQDVASAIKTFLGECWYDTTIGIPYFEDVLGQDPPIPIIEGLIEEAALTVPGIVRAKATITAFEDRQIQGQVEVINTEGVANNVSF